MGDTGFKWATAGDAGYYGYLQSEDGVRWNVASAWPAWSTINNLTTFNFAIPPGKAITGIEVRCRLWAPYAVATILRAYLSWNGGVNTAFGEYVNWSSPTGYFYGSIGGPTSLWGRVWTDTDFSNVNFHVKLMGQTYGSQYGADTFWIKVYYSDIVPKELAGIIPGASGLGGDLQKIQLLAGVSNGVSALSGDMVTTTPIAGVIPAVSSLPNTTLHDISDPLSGQVTAVSNVGGFVRPKFSVLYVPDHVDQMKNRLIEQFK